MLPTASVKPTFPGAPAAGMGRYRWTICALIFFATTVNYLDRAVISLLKPYLEKIFGWNAGDYANIEIAFKVAYSVGMLGAGRIIDKLGTKIGYALATFLWSLAAIGHALVSSTLGFSVARAALGVTEAGNFPAAIKATAEWFPQKERALATGIFNSGSNVGAILAPLTVPFIAEKLGWQWAFIITGALGFVWLILWFIYYEVPARQARLSQAEFDYITYDEDEPAALAGTEQQPKVSWFKLLTYRQTYAFVFGKFLTDPIWWFYLFWLPDFLSKQYGLTGTDIALPVALVYMLSSVGSVGGGWIPLRLIKSGMAPFRARQLSMLLIAFCVLPIVFAQRLGQVNMWLAVLVIGLAAAAHQAWSANIFTTVSDMFPKRAVGSVTGIGGMAGGLGGILLSALVQKRMFVYYESIGQLDHAYYIMFWICGGAYLLAWVLMQAFAPRLEKVNLDAAPAAS
ncbi:MFS transporter [Hymenobacter actinosclerus]|uniref:MFS transporter, ACS family, hexuronate transporter n=1 Tax=Hymenobacter actinosclerus TaxID=82805 RepID=A0A1I0F6Q1_9BACT|nr:MFS transporter [Hymenobacter actinosclerus]SET52766.1 MFS transporter, ACS family, hexuronate transporter [Hymenobacter actinosclerus]